AAPTGGDSSRVSEKEQQLYSVKEPQGSGNPYQWDFDLCSQTLGNFNYRKMSLVQDYAALLEQDVPGRAFEALFTQQAKALDLVEPPSTPLKDQFPVVDCDPTQTLAVARARLGQSYIIQGPPGTGKSQTITNLIADFVAQGKRVLFVCEKRAAIDVVFHRLGRQQLDELCCLIHDSQTDKRDFIRNLKQTYEAFLNEPIDETIETRRAELTRQMDLELAALKRWTDALEAKVAGCSVAVRELLARLVDLRTQAVDLDPLAFEQVPSYAAWSPHAEVVRSLSTGLKRVGGKASLAEHSFRHLTVRALTSPQPLAAITAAVDGSEKLLGKITTSLAALGETVAVQSFSEIETVVAYASEIAAAAAADSLDLLNPRGTRTRKAAKAVREWRSTEQALAKAQKASAGWKEKLPSPDTTAALAQAKTLESSVFRFLSPAFWKLRGILQARYHFAAHAIAPSWSQVLSELAEEYRAVEEFAKARAVAEEAFAELSFDDGLRLIETLPARISELSPAARALHNYLLENSEATYVAENLAGLQPTLTRLRECLGLVMADYATLTREELAAELKQLRKDLVWLPDVLPVLLDALRLPLELQRTLRALPLSDVQLEAAMARKSLTEIYQGDRTFESTDGRLLARRVARLQANHLEWLGLNARWIHQQVRREFLRKVRISTTPASQLTPEERNSSDSTSRVGASWNMSFQRQ
ncbi:MAG: AAA domain-containing protein, partial [Opitutaceae bacterium]